MTINLGMLPTMKLVAALSVLAVGGAVFFLQRSRSQSVLVAWATANGFEIVRSDLRYFNRGPFFWTTSKGQTVYYVTVRDPRGGLRSGWVRCGSWWFGIWSNQAEVRWVD